MPPRRLILASASPRRQELLRRLEVPFEVFPADVVEHEDPDSDPEETVCHNARIKASQVALRHPEAIVLGSDTAVAIDGQVLHKPESFTEARHMLKRLSGRTHVVHTAVSFCWKAGVLNETTHHTSEVTFKVLTEAAITRYFSRVNPLDKAGAYGIQAGRELIIADVKGSVTNVMGLPVEWLASRLRELGFSPTVS